jgi:hypothetical protein
MSFSGIFIHRPVATKSSISHPRATWERRFWIFTPLFEKEGLGEIFLINPPRSPFFKGGRRFNLMAVTRRVGTRNTADEQGELR